MSMATIVGGLIAYPINHWLVANRLKHGCMTLAEADKPTPVLGHASPEPSMMMDHAHMHYAAGSVGAMYRPHDHAMNELPAGRAAIIIAVTFAVLLAAVWLTSFVVPVRF